LVFFLFFKKKDNFKINSEKFEDFELIKKAQSKGIVKIINSFVFTQGSRIIKNGIFSILFYNN
jgi:hypothetical protein